MTKHTGRKCVLYMSGIFFYNILCSLFYPPPPSLYYFGVYMFDIKKDMSPLNYALQYEMSKKLSKLLFTVDDDIMSVEPLIGDSNYNSIATIRRNGNITQVKYNRKKLDDMLNENCLAKQRDDNGKYSHIYLTPLAAPKAGTNLPGDWDAEQTDKYLKLYGLTWDRSMASVMDTSDRVFNMVGARNPVGIFDMSKDIAKSGNDTYLIRNVENNVPFGILTVKYGEQVNIRVPLNVKYLHELMVSNGSVPKQISDVNRYAMVDGKTLQFTGGLGDAGYITHGWVDSSLVNYAKPDISNDSTMLYTIRYDSNGLSVSFTDDVKTTHVERYETLTDSVFICLAFSYRDLVVSPESRPEIVFTITKQVDTGVPALSTLTFPLARRVSNGIVTYDSSGKMDIKPVGPTSGPKECLLNYRCRLGINRLKFATEIAKAFNSEYISEVVVGFTTTGLDAEMSLPYLKFIKQSDGNWNVMRGDRPNQPFTFGDDDLKNIDIIYNSTQKKLIAYAKTDPDDNSALDTDVVAQTPSTTTLIGEQDFFIAPNNTTVYDFSVKLTYNETFDKLPIIKTTRYTPGPSETVFNFVTAVYTTVGNHCTTHYGSTTLPVSFVNSAIYDYYDKSGGGYCRIAASAHSIAGGNNFTMKSNNFAYLFPSNRRLVITTERINADNLLAGKYQGIVVSYSDVKGELSDGGVNFTYAKCDIVNTLPAIFSLKDVNDTDAIENAGIDYVAHPITLLGTEPNQKKSYQLLVDLSVTEYFIYDIGQDYVNYGSDTQS